MSDLMKQLMKKPEKSWLNAPKFIERFEAGYMDGTGPKFTKKKSFSPSTLAYGNGACPRYWNIAFAGAEFADDRNPYSVANMSSGTMSHERIQNAMLSSGLAKEVERKIVCEDPPIFGYGDVILDLDEVEDEEVVGEIKTMREESFAHRKATGKAPTYHLVQLLIYMKVLKLRRGVLIYENKNSHEIVLIPVEINGDYIQWADQLFEWLREVKKASDDEQLPTKPYRSNSKICKNCPVKAACDEAGKGVITIPVMPVLPE
jgi:CRISPR/Cas system-associated exonuclease Cas4 (RecB family)